MIEKKVQRSTSICRVTFKLPEEIQAREAYLVGDFNNWDEHATPMKHLKKDHQFAVTLDLEVGHEYHFRYLVNGKDWFNDLNADRYDRNPYGSEDSVIVT